MSDPRDRLTAMSTLRVAVTQPTASPDPRRNGAVTRQLMRTAAAQGARLVLFPEGHLSGYAKEQVSDLADVDWSVVHEETEAVAELAGELGLWVVLGSSHPLTPPHRPHNSMYVISDTGRVIDRYDKRFCSAGETFHHYTPGTDPTTFEVDGYRFGIAVCVEINFLNVFTEYAALGVDCLLLPAYPIDAIFRTKAQAMAAINTYWVAVSSVAQRRRLVPAEVFGPDGTSLTAAAGDEAIVLAELNRDDPQFHIALDLARPWRGSAHDGSFYRGYLVDDPRSSVKTAL
ncbi:carbon-nitrogen hydrolase family protein [Cellulomonas dongxiuzhuiae]|uniref:carbon-nitrogen hydrolase family protein n=1 Tax=Cellulomonas dongxiuzhuiae TaxID=2819979 RepID=UPI001AB01697|nr:carbon-nitrogen hydrolase family protein [Cellulomonas dongxiuzhuiae]MBO3090036.1 carbon-nitrogen hydrolase family protein [Cellulomonas dongxiuzhuiae]